MRFPAYEAAAACLLANERPVVPTRMLSGRGCERALLEPPKRSAAIVVDDAVHELGTAYHLRGRGLVVIGSCSHRGILNTIRQAQLVFGVERIHAVMGASTWSGPRRQSKPSTLPGKCRV